MYRRKFCHKTASGTRENEAAKGNFLDEPASFMMTPQRERGCRLCEWLLVRADARSEIYILPFPRSGHYKTRTFTALLGKAKQGMTR